ncbi:MAG: hypothetical protein ACYSSI_02630 [Planctomycetota bacterium]|jgi:hypothetical protein
MTTTKTTEKMGALRKYLESRSDEEKTFAIVLNSLICCKNKELDNMAQNLLRQWRTELAEMKSIPENPIDAFAAGIACGLLNAD